MSWVANETKGERMLWLYGDVGAGKSAIAQTLAERCYKAQLLAVCFFSRNDGARASHLSLWQH